MASRRGYRVRMQTRMPFLWGAAWVALAAAGGAAGQSSLAVKHVAAPPEDVASGLVVLPDPRAAATGSRTLWLDVAWAPAQAGPRGAAAPAGGWEWEARIPMDGEHLALLLVSADATRMDAQLVALQAGTPAVQHLPAVSAEVPAAPGRITRSQTLADGVDVVRHDLWKSPEGEALLRLTAPDPARTRVALVFDSPETLWAAATSWRTVVGEPVPLEAWLSVEASKAPWPGLVGPTRVEVREPDGGVLELSAAPKDGRIVAASFTPRVPGVHMVRVDAEGRSVTGRALRRSVEFVVNVAARRSFAGAPALTQEPDGTLLLDLPVQGAAAGERLLAAAEVWMDGRCRCWSAVVADPSQQGGVARLRVDPRWLAASGPGEVAAEVELRQLRLHSLREGVVLDLRESVRVPAARVQLPAPWTGPPDEAMRMGRPGAASIEVAGDAPAAMDAPAFVNAGAHALMLSHGYCADGNPFTLSDFSGPVELFLDPGQNRSIDTFATMVGLFGQAQKSFGLVAHSQGGMAALHLHTFYWSGMDWAGSGRLIQSVGTPYQGTPMAGNAAVLGQIFGIGCGINTDLTPAGATAWLSTIPGWARTAVWYWTTSFTDNWWSWDYCNILTDALLADPDDGVTEKNADQLPGATNMGHKEGWCHTTGMEDPPQCTDHTRNAEMNGSAAR